VRIRARAQHRELGRAEDALVETGMERVLLRFRVPKVDDVVADHAADLAA
jgi:hypothetical protein